MRATILILTLSLCGLARADDLAIEEYGSVSGPCDWSCEGWLGAHIYEPTLGTLEGLGYFQAGSTFEITADNAQNLTMFEQCSALLEAGDGTLFVGFTPINACVPVGFVAPLVLGGSTGGEHVTKISIQFEIADFQDSLYTIGWTFRVWTEETFTRGDCNGIGTINLADGIYLLATLFTSTVAQPACRDACDVNDDGGIDIGDAVYLLGALYAGGSPPPSPWPQCGGDVDTVDVLDCSTYGNCP